jgi:drug/metabolite transporter (DMT)-like permease
MASLGAFTAVFLWGASFAATKRLVEEISPATLLFARSTLGMLLVLSWVVLRRGLRPLRAEDVPSMLLLALLGNVLTQ